MFLSFFSSSSNNNISTDQQQQQEEEEEEKEVKIDLVNLTVGKRLLVKCDEIKQQRDILIEVIINNKSSNIIMQAECAVNVNDLRTSVSLLQNYSKREQIFGLKINHMGGVKYHFDWTYSNVQHQNSLGYRLYENSMKHAEEAYKIILDELVKYCESNYDSMSRPYSCAVSWSSFTEICKRYSIFAIQYLHPHNGIGAPKDVHGNLIINTCSLKADFVRYLSFQDFQVIHKQDGSGLLFSWGQNK